MAHRYDYKKLKKIWWRKQVAAEKGTDNLALIEAKDMVLLYESIQLAHKCILNSFYGRKHLFVIYFLSFSYVFVVSYNHMYLFVNMYAFLKCS